LPSLSSPNSQRPVSTMRAFLILSLLLLLFVPSAFSQSKAIPFTEKDGVIYIQVTVSDRLVWGMVDSGASVTNVDASLVESKGCVYRTIATMTGTTTGCERMADVKAAGMLVASKVTAYKFPSSLSTLKVILSLRDLAQGGSVTIDYANKVITVTPKRKIQVSCFTPMQRKEKTKQT
jgi:hypothetical protein